jgi:hypothetical protein
MQRHLSRFEIDVFRFGFIELARVQLETERQSLCIVLVVSG